MRRTPWISAGYLPVRTGWYEVKSVGWNCKRLFWSDGWHAWVPARRGDGLVSLGLYRGDVWRGLVKKGDPQ